MKSAGWCNGFAASAAALRQREKERARDSLGRFPGLISRCLRSFASSPLLFLLPTARICPRRAVATRKNARVRMLPAKKEEGLGRSSECWERHTAKHPAIPSECNMHIHRYITTRLVSEQVIHMFGAVLWVAKTWREAGITEPVRGSFDKHPGRRHNPRACSVSDRQDIIKLVARRS